MPTPSNYQGKQQGYGGRGNDQRQNQRREEPTTLDTSKVKFEPLTPELFSDVAKQMAEGIAKADRKYNKQTQIRKFYDELCMWEMKVSTKPEKFDEYKPFILMLNAKTAYAKGRDLIDGNFQEFLKTCLREGTKNVETFRISKLFFEAFLGFYKELRRND